MAERMGPMQGVQPKANAKPMANALEHGFSAGDGVHALVGVESFDLQQAGKVQSEEDDDRAGHDAEDAAIIFGDLSELGGGGA